MLGKFFSFHIGAFHTILDTLYFALDFDLHHDFMTLALALDSPRVPLPPVNCQDMKNAFLRAPGHFSKGARAFSDCQGMPGHYSDTPADGYTRSESQKT